jgi:hypothetical protein
MMSACDCGKVEGREVSVGSREEDVRQAPPWTKIMVPDREGVDAWEEGEGDGEGEEGR